MVAAATKAISLYHAEARETSHLQRGGPVGGPACSEEARELGIERGRMSAVAIYSSTDKLKEADVTNRTG